MLVLSSFSFHKAKGAIVGRPCNVDSDCYYVDGNICYYDGDCATLFDKKICQNYLEDPTKPCISGNKLCTSWECTYEGWACSSSISCDSSKNCNSNSCGSNTYYCTYDGNSWAWRTSKSFEDCTDGIDNDCDGKVDMNDEDCWECSSDSDCETIFEWNEQYGPENEGRVTRVLGTADFVKGAEYKFSVEEYDEDDNRGEEIVEVIGGTHYYLGNRVSDAWQSVSQIFTASSTGTYNIAMKHTYSCSLFWCPKWGYKNFKIIVETPDFARCDNHICIYDAAEGESCSVNDDCDAFSNVCATNYEGSGSICCPINCAYKGECYDVGSTAYSGYYCDGTEWKELKESGDSCSEDYECSSNKCAGNTCCSDSQCVYSNACYDVGSTAYPGYYCVDGDWLEQKSNGEVCSNDYECSVGGCYSFSGETSRICCSVNCVYDGACYNVNDEITIGSGQDQYTIVCLSSGWEGVLSSWSDFASISDVNIIANDAFLSEKQDNVVVTVDAEKKGMNGLKLINQYSVSSDGTISEKEIQPPDSYANQYLDQVEIDNQITYSYKSQEIKYFDGTNTISINYPYMTVKPAILQINYKNYITYFDKANNKLNVFDEEGNLVKTVNFNDVVNIKTLTFDINKNIISVQKSMTSGIELYIALVDNLDDLDNLKEVETISGIPKSVRVGYYSDSSEKVLIAWLLSSENKIKYDVFNLESFSLIKSGEISINIGADNFVLTPISSNDKRPVFIWQALNLENQPTIYYSQMLSNYNFPTPKVLTRGKIPIIISVDEDSTITSARIVDSINNEIFSCSDALSCGFTLTDYYGKKVLIKYLPISLGFKIDETYTITYMICDLINNDAGNCVNMVKNFKVVHSI